MSPEFTNPRNELALPDDIHGLLENSLLPANELNAVHTATEKYFVEDHPDLFVRLNRNEHVENVHAGLQATLDMQEHGINVLPFALVEHRGQSYVITKKVDGQTLSDILTDDLNPELLRQIDTTWQNLGNTLWDAKIQSKRVCTDVDGPHQYMFGTISGDTHPKIWLTDLPDFAIDITHPEDHANAAVNLANGIVQIETLIHQKLPLARVVAEKVIESINREEQWSKAKARMGRHVLTHGIEISPYEEEEVEEFWDDV